MEDQRRNLEIGCIAKVQLQVLRPLRGEGWGGKRGSKIGMQNQESIAAKLMSCVALDHQIGSS